MKIGDPLLTEGTISADVTEAQKILQGQGYNVGPIDGNFGPQTRAAVIAFQKTKGLTPDGIIGPDTWAALRGQFRDLPVAPLPPPPEQQVKPAPSLWLSMPVLWGVGGLMLIYFFSQNRKLMRMAGGRA